MYGGLNFFNRFFVNMVIKNTYICEKNSVVVQKLLWAMFPSITIWHINMYHTNHNVRLILKDYTESIGST